MYNREKRVGTSEEKQTCLDLYKIQKNLVRVHVRTEIDIVRTDFNRIMTLS